MNTLLIRRRAIINKEQSYVDWLKSIGCVVWLPLSENGDLQDRISGLSLTLSGKGSMTWDAAKQMYRIKTPTTVYQYVALLNNGFTKSWFDNDEYTTMSTFCKITTYAGCRAPITQVNPISTDSTTLPVLSTSFNTSTDTSLYPGTTVKLAKVETENYRKFYQNGILFETRSPAPQILPSNWVLSGTGITIGTVRADQTGYKGVEYYIKDIYIFNKELTIDQITRIQSHGNASYDADVEYVEMSPSQYIDTGLAGSFTDLSLEFKSMTTSWASYGSVMGNYKGENYNTVRFILQNSDNGKAYASAGARASSSMVFDYSLNDWHIITIDTTTKTATCDGVSHSETTSGTNNDNNIAISNTRVGTTNTITNRFAYFKAMQGTTPLIDLIPVRVGQVGYMYDKVSGQLFGNQGTGNFVLGADK